MTRTRLCTKCGSEEQHAHAHKRCGGCRMNLYCGPQCQGEDWRAHKGTCRLLAERNRKLVASGALPLAVARKRLAAWMTDPFNGSTMTLLANRACHGADAAAAYVVSLDDEGFDHDTAARPESEVASEGDIADAHAFACGNMGAHIVVVVRLRGTVIVCPAVQALPERVWRDEMASLVDEARDVQRLLDGGDAAASETQEHVEASIESAMGASMTAALHPGLVAMHMARLRSAT